MPVTFTNSTSVQSFVSKHMCKLILLISDKKYLLSAHEEFYFRTTFVFSYTKCGCIDPYEWTARHLVVPGTNNTITAPVCSQDNKCYREELDRINSNYDIWIQNCPMCTLECKSTDFLTKLSSLLAPMQWLMDDLKPKIETLSVPLPTDWSNTWQSEISQNYIALEVVSESARLEILNDTASIGPIDLLSNIGGQTGLWIGISFLSLIEIFEMIYRLIRLKFCKLRKKLNQRSSA